MKGSKAVSSVVFQIARFAFRYSALPKYLTISVVKKMLKPQDPSRELNLKNVPKLPLPAPRAPASSHWFHLIVGKRVEEQRAAEQRKKEQNQNQQQDRHINRQ